MPKNRIGTASIGLSTYLLSKYVHTKYTYVLRMYIRMIYLCVMVKNQEEHLACSMYFRSDTMKPKYVCIQI